MAGSDPLFTNQTIRMDEVFHSSMYKLHITVICVVFLFSKSCFKERFLSCSGFLHCEDGDFLILMRDDVMPAVDRSTKKTKLELVEIHAEHLVYERWIGDEMSN